MVIPYFFNQFVCFLTQVIQGDNGENWLCCICLLIIALNSIFSKLVTFCVTSKHGFSDILGAVNISVSRSKSNQNKDAA
jgi:hypothetical protein